MPVNDLNLLQRLAAVQAEVDYIQKEKKQGMRYSIVSHDAVTAKVRPLMVKHGVLYYPAAIEMEQVGNRTQMKVDVFFANVDNPTEVIKVVTAGYGVDDSDKGPGKAMSYAIKYALLKCLGLETGDDPDEDQNSEFKPVRYPDPPRRASGLPETGYREDGARTPHALRKEAADGKPDNWLDFEREVDEAMSASALTILAKAWGSISERDLWPQDWRILAKERINDRREALKNAPENDDTFPGDR
jgi:ERF superfamily